MDKDTQKKVEKIINALNEYFNQAMEKRNVSLIDFVKFMEPKFIEAGYRQSTPPVPGSKQRF